MSVTFNGLERLIIVDTGITELDVQEDIYELWKDWVLTGTGAIYPPAFLSEGNIDIGGGLFTGKFFILINDWKIRPHEAEHQLKVTGNIFATGGADIFVPTLGTYNVITTIERSLQAEGVATSGGSLSASDVWAHVDPVTGKTMTQLVRGDIDGLTIEKAMIVMLSVLANKFSVTDLGGGTSEVTFFKRDELTSTLIGEVNSGVRTTTEIQEINL